MKFNEQSIIVDWGKTKRILSIKLIDQIQKNISLLSGKEKLEYLKGYFFQNTPFQKNPFQPKYRRPLVLIDPGHTACNFREAVYEKKYLSIHTHDPLLQNEDTIRFYEAYYTGLTAYILENLLRTEGIQVMLTRNPSGGSAFGVCYEEFLKNREYFEKKFRYAFPKKNSKKWNDPHAYSREIFRDADLRQRKHILENTDPDIVVSIHYNVDENNKPWISSVNKNYSMAFIPGAYDSIPHNDTSKFLNFISLLLSNVIPDSKKLCHHWINFLQQNIRVMPAHGGEADYLKNECLPTNTRGVFARNLAMTNALPCVVLYGEGFLMDSAEEIQRAKQTMKFQGKDIPISVYQTALAYYRAIMEYLKK